MKAEFEKQFLEAVKSGNVPESLIGDIFNDYAEKICMAINPMDKVSAPFLIAALNAYSEVIAMRYPGARLAACNLSEGIGSVCVNLPITKGGGPG